MRLHAYVYLHLNVQLDIYHYTCTITFMLNPQPVLCLLFVRIRIRVLVLVLASMRLPSTDTFTILYRLNCVKLIQPIAGAKPPQWLHEGFALVRSFVPLVSSLSWVLWL